MLITRRSAVSLLAARREELIESIETRLIWEGKKSRVCWFHPKVAVADGYLLMTLLSFIILIVVARHSRGDDIRHFNGLGKRSPFLAFGMTVAIASLAGIPLTAGFLGKFLIFKTAVASGQWTLIGIGIIGVAAGFYYYFKVIAAMYWQEPGDKTPITVSFLTRASVSILAVLIIVLGLWPNPVLNQLKDAPAADHTLVAKH